MSLICLDDDQYVLRFKDSDGNLLEMAGYSRTLEIGDFISVTAYDISKEFERWKVTRSLQSLTLGQLLAAIVANPTGDTDTGIVCHCEEVPTSGGEVIRLGRWYGNARPLSDWLNEFAQATGFRWYVESVAGVWHFWWINPSTQADWTVTLHDDTDRADDSATSWRVGDGVTVKRDRSGYLNRLRYRAHWDPPLPPYGYTWDTYFTEGTTGWAYKSIDSATFTLSADASVKKTGSNSLKCTWTGTVPAATAIRGYTYRQSYVLGIAYFVLPAAYQNQYQKQFGTWRFRNLQKYSVGASEATPDERNQMRFYWILDERDLSDSARLEALLKRTQSAYAAAHPDDPVTSFALGQANDTAWGEWNDGILANPAGHNAPYLGIEPENLQHVYAIGVEVGFQVGAAAGAWCKAGDTVTVEQWIDDLRPVTPETQAWGTPDGEDFVIETAAVTAGTDRPVEGTLDTSGMGYTEAHAMAAKKLAKWSRTQETIGNLTLDGIRAVPMRATVPLALPAHGIRATSQPLVQATWRLLEAGDSTELTVGDVPFDEKRSVETLKRYIDGLATGKATS